MHLQLDEETNRVRYVPSDRSRVTIHSIDCLVVRSGQISTYVSHNLVINVNRVRFNVQLDNSVEDFSTELIDFL